MPEKPYCAAHVLSLAESAGVVGDLDRVPMPEVVQRVECFISEYKSWTEGRDRAVIERSLDDDSVFRIALPYGPDAIRTAAEICWYFDEVVISDPLEDVMDLSRVISWKDQYPVVMSVPEEYLRLRRAQLVISSLEYLRSVEPLLDAGRIAIVGMLRSNEAPKELLVDVLGEAMSDARLRLQVFKGFILEQANIYDVADSSAWSFRRVQSPMRWAMAIERREKLGPFQSVTLATPDDCLFREVSWPPHDEVLPDGFSGIMYDLAMDYLRSLAAAGSRAYGLGVGALTSGTLEDELLKRICLTKGTAGHASDLSSTSFRAALPVLQGVDPRVLLELRESLPDAFDDFRNRLSSIAERSENPESAMITARKEFSELERKLESELKPVLARSRALAYGTTAVIAAGELIGTVVDPGVLPPWVTLFGGLSGLATAVKAFADSRAARVRARYDPAFFSWEAKKQSRSK